VSFSGYPLLSRLLFRLDPETAHRATLSLLRLLPYLPPLRSTLAKRWQVRDARLSQKLLGLRFPGPLGLAAGFDKDGRVVPAMTALGFSFLELGTVTPVGQPGNPRPRLFRYPEQASLRNALGFNNQGGEALSRRLKALHPWSVPLGVNLGRNKTTPPERAADDYYALLERLDGLCDYFVINVSSPNTPGLREMQEERALGDLLREARRRSSTPLLVKLSPDLAPARAAELAEAVVEAGAIGVLLTNTTIDYGLLPGAPEVGGLSGRVLRERSFATLQAVAKRLYGRCILVSIGGIDSAEEAYRRLRAGASLVQLYSALVFEGPGVAARIQRGLLELLDRDGLGSIAAAVGADLPAAGSRGAPR
jgi:dihydroorotate dehydrogenase